MDHAMQNKRQQKVRREKQVTQKANTYLHITPVVRMSDCGEKRRKKNNQASFVVDSSKSLLLVSNVYSNT